MDMLLFDALSPEIPAAIVAQAKTKLRSDGLYGAVGACVVVAKSVHYESGELSWISEKAIASPAGAAMILFQEHPVDLDESLDLLLKAEDGMTVIEYPKHGDLEKRPGDFIYKPSPNYIGKDRAIFMVEFEGYRIKVIYHIHVTEETVNYDGTLGEWKNFWKKYCPQQTWEILPESLNSDPANWYQNLSLQFLLASAKKD
jgi:hypothetical protein